MQVSVLLPRNHKYKKLEVEQRRAGAGVLVGFQSAKNQGLLDSIPVRNIPEKEVSVYFNITFRDTRCDNVYGPKTFTDAIVSGVHVLFGPSCDYALGKNRLLFL